VAALKVIAYVVAFLLGPTLGALGSAVTLALMVSLRGILADNRNLWRLLRGLGSILSGVLAVWVGRWVFSWFGYRPSVLMVVLMGGAFVIFSIRHLSEVFGSENLVDELVNDLAYVVGLVVGAVRFDG